MINFFLECHKTLLFNTSVFATEKISVKLICVFIRNLHYVQRLFDSCKGMVT